MPVFRGRSSAHRRRSTAGRISRHARARWAPPGRSAAADVTIRTERFFEPFDQTALASLWRDNGSTAVTTGAGLVMAPAVGTNTSEVQARIPMSLAGKSITWDWRFPAVTFRQTGPYALIGLRDTITGDLQVAVWLHFDGADWRVGTSIGVDGSPWAGDDVTTDGTEWRFVRADSDPADTSTVTLYRSADGFVWSTVGAFTFADVTSISSLLLYAYTEGPLFGAVGPASTFANLTGWTLTDDAAVSSARLALGGTVGAGHARKVEAFDFVDGSVTLEAWPDAGNTGTTAWFVNVYRTGGSAESLRIGVDSSGDLYWQSVVSGVTVVGAYSSTTHRWLRIVNYGGDVYFDTSPSGAAGTWITRGSMPVADLVGGTGAGFTGVEFDFTSTVITDVWYVDNLNQQ